MTVIRALDPGSSQSAWLDYDTEKGRPVAFGIEPNGELLTMLRGRTNHGRVPGVDVLVIEKIEGYGMAVGAEVFETVYWSGQFAEAAQGPQGRESLPRTDVARLGRKAVKVNVCGSTQAKDANIRQALIDRFGGTPAIRKGGVLYGISKDVWAALGVAVTYADQEADR
jgi:hypothetical protein